MLRLRLHPAAQFEGLGAHSKIGADDYQQGELFVDALEATFAKIKQSPLIYPCFDGEFRRIKVGKFTYSVIFRIRPGELQVIAIMHQHRKPGYWKDRADRWTE